MVGGPLLGAFTLGMACPWANWQGALAGLWTAFGVAAWLGLGALGHGIAKVRLPLGDACEAGAGGNESLPLPQPQPLPPDYNRVKPADGDRCTGS